MKAPDPPDHFKPEQVAAWRNLYALNVRRGTWMDIDAPVLEVAAYGAGLYVRLAREVRALGDAATPALIESVEANRRVARQALAEMAAIAEGREHIGSVTAEGLDADIARICQAPEDPHA